MLNFLSNSQVKTFRVNNFKTNSKVCISNLLSQGFSITEGPFKNSFICISTPENTKLSETKESQDLLIYIQELSSMIPALMLDLKPDEKILDICAAPGSKTVQIADMLENKAEIVANEQSRERFFKLQMIVKNYGANVKTIKENGKILPYKYKNYVQYFDRILLDAPCSNESSLIFGLSESFKFWRSSNSSKLSKLQKGLLSSALTMLKPGGTLIYSTCTFAVEENEEVINWALKKFPNIKLESFKDKLKIDNIKEGLVEYKNKVFDSTLSKTIRIFPNEHFKGFYLAKITKY